MAKPASYREKVQLPGGFRDRASGELYTEAEVRAVTGGDELEIGRSRDYAAHDSDLMYKYLLLTRTVTRLGPLTDLGLDQVKTLKLRDVQALEDAVYNLTFGEDTGPRPALPPGKVHLPVGYEDPATGEIHHDAEVREVIGADEIAISKSADYKAAQNQLVYKIHLLSHTVTRLGPRKLVTLSDIEALHARDVRALETAVYRLTYGDDSVSEKDGVPPG